MGVEVGEEGWGALKAQRLDTRENCGTREVTEEWTTEDFPPFQVQWHSSCALFRCPAFNSPGSRVHQIYDIRVLLCDDLRYSWTSADKTLPSGHFLNLCGSHRKKNNAVLIFYKRTACSPKLTCFLARLKPLQLSVSSGLNKHRVTLPQDKWVSKKTSKQTWVERRNEWRNGIKTRSSRTPVFASASILQDPAWLKIFSKRDYFLEFYTLN